MMHTPLSTYRLQLRGDFGFAEAQGILPYLERLGITDLYLSPILKSTSGSLSGYDVVDPALIDPELGGKEAFRSFSAAAKASGMKIILDIVPNHMAYSSQNRFLKEVMEHGNRSGYSRFFDIDWDHHQESLKKRLLAPFLGRFLGECLNDGEISVGFGPEGFFIRYYDLHFPMKIETYGDLLKSDLQGLQEQMGQNDANYIKFLGAVYLLEELIAKPQPKNRTRQAALAKGALWELHEQDPRIREYVRRALSAYRSTGENSAPLERLLDEQTFRLSFWKVANQEINYRRFFNINELICLRVEDQSVFEQTHQRIFGLVDDGDVAGLRVDHIDGLYDPLAYLQRLRQRLPESYLVVEKILDTAETLPQHWPVQGTTGYDFLNGLNGLFCRSESEGRLTKFYVQFSKMARPCETYIQETKRLIIGKNMAGDIDNLAHLLKKLSGKNSYGGDITLVGLRNALTEVMAFMPVYRTYVRGDAYADADRGYIASALGKAKAHAPDLTYELKWIETCLLSPEGFSDELRPEVLHFIMRFQQYSGPVTAKGFEDTLLYVYNRLVSLNEVGGSPNYFGGSLQNFHDFVRRRSASWPLSMNATSTHDAKRGEDVRARINVISEMPQEWEQQVKLWHRLNRRKKKTVCGTEIPDRNDEYLLYQTLVGTCLFDGGEGYAERIKSYMIKAIREAKVHTAWIKPDEVYEQNVADFVDKLLDPASRNRFLQAFSPFAAKVAFYGFLNTLSQAVVKLSVPGVSDFYQGTELMDLNLVDPDNRRAVDFARADAMLEEIRALPGELSDYAAELLKRGDRDRIKLFLTHRLLAFRRNDPLLFLEGEYLPLPVHGEFGDHVIAFARRHEKRWVIAVAPRFCTALVGEGAYPLGTQVWKETSLTLPEGAPRSWRNVITDTPVGGEEELSVGEVLGHFPCALLAGEAR